MQLLRVLIGSMCCLCLLWLAEVITLVLVLGHSFENSSNYALYHKVDMAGQVLRTYPCDKSRRCLNYPFLSKNRVEETQLWYLILLPRNIVRYCVGAVRSSYKIFSDLLRNNRTNNRTMDPSPENNRAAWYQGPMKVEAVKSCVVSDCVPLVRKAPKIKNKKSK